MMKKVLLSVVCTLSAMGSLLANDTVRVGGKAMYPSKNIVENAVNSADHTTLVAAVKAAGLVETLQSKGPFTVFAPVNAAFSELPEGTVATLLKPENKDKLVSVLTYHVVAGNLNFKALERQIKMSNGKATLKTVQGGILVAKMNGENILLEDAHGNVSNITITNVNQSNGLIHVIDHVLMP